MKYLIRKFGSRRKAHLCTGEDTVCHMASTGGLNVSHYNVTDNIQDYPLCSMCETMSDLKSKEPRPPDIRQCV